MADVIFIQRSQFGRSIFALRGENLEITSHLFGRKSDASIPIRTISPYYVLGAQRLWGLIFVPLLLAAVSIAVSRVAVDYEGLGTGLAIDVVIFGAACAFAAIRGARRVEYFLFSDHWKRALFSIVREPKQTDECDAFVRELLNRIEGTESDLHVENAEGQSAPRSAVHVPTPEDANDGPRAERQWILAIAAGVVSAAFPIATAFAVPEYAPLDVPVVVTACACSAVTAAVSYSAKERKRHWSIVGVVLALVPLVFY